MVSMSFDHRSGKPKPERMPPLHTLEVFVVAARCGTFSRAAKELFVTQSAVSRQIQLLEEHFGVSLFIRHKTGLRMTPEAEMLLPVLSDAFGQIQRVCANLLNAGQVLTLRMPPTIAGRWFLPLLPSLKTRMPDMDVRVTTYEAWSPRFGDQDIDAAIIHGKSNWQDVEAIPLMPELLTPVCSPEMASRLTSVNDLMSMPLLHCHPLQAWQLWLEAAGVAKVPSRRGQSFDTLDLVLSAATRGQGVAMGDINLMRESLRDGVLVAPFDLVLDRGVSYFLIYPTERRHLPKIRLLREWLAETADPTSAL